MPQVQVWRLQTPRSSLASLPEGERRLVLLLGQAVNELSTLNRLLLFSLEKVSPDEVSERIAIGRAWVVLTLLAGKVWESLVLLDQRINSNASARPFLLKLSEAAREAKKRSDKRRDRSNILFKIRNNHGFHFANDAEIDAAFAALPLDEPLEILLSENGDVTFHQNSSIVSMIAVLHGAKGASLQDRVGVIADELNDAVGDLQNLFGELVAIILESATGTLNEPMLEVQVDAPSRSTVSVPPVTVR